MASMGRKNSDLDVEFKTVEFSAFKLGFLKKKKKKFTVQWYCCWLQLLCTDMGKVLITLSKSRANKPLSEWFQLLGQQQQCFNYNE